MKRGFREKLISSSSLVFFMQDKVSTRQSFFFHFEISPIDSTNELASPNLVFNYSDFKFTTNSKLLEVTSPQIQQRLRSLFDFTIDDQLPLQIQLKNAPRELQLLKITKVKTPSIPTQNKSNL